MGSETEASAAGFARSLIAKHAAPEMITEAGRFGAPSAELEGMAEPRLDEILPRNLPPDVSRDEAAAVALKVTRSETLDDRETFITEAIIIPELRPAVFVTDGEFSIDHPAWTDFVAGTPAHANLVNAIPSVGRIELIGNPSIPYGGTGFVVAPQLLMTNRHVAQLFTAGIGTGDLRFLDGLGSAVDFLREQDSGPPGTPFRVSRVAMIHPFWDLALLEVEGLERRTPLRFLSVEPGSATPRRMAVIGYPAFDPRNDAQVQNQVFGGVYGVKRLQPGLFNGRRQIGSFGKTVPAATHDSSTLGGNSGSVVVDAASGQVLGLHFAGIYKDSNFAVPAADLARDRRMIDAGLDFAGGASPMAGPWDGYWAEADRRPVERPAAPPPRPAEPPAGPATPVAAGQVVTVPLQVQLTVGLAGVSLGVAAEALDAAPSTAGPIDRGPQPAPWPVAPMTLAGVVERLASGEPPVATDIESVEDHGRFSGLPVQIALNEDGRSAKLLAPLLYIGLDERRWLAPTGAWLDGASIPKAFWSVIGGPFEGRYREASIVHDHYCITKARTWRDTHRMFHEAMLCRGVSAFKARLMFYAVYRFGPRWIDPSTIEGVAAVPTTGERLDDSKAASILADATLLRDDLSVDEIEAVADRSASDGGTAPADGVSDGPAAQDDDVVRDSRDGHADPADPATEATEGLETPVGNWRVAEALATLRQQVNDAFPRRRKGNDGTIGDLAHQSRSSDHNAWIVDGARRVVSAIDITHDPASGCDANHLVAALHASRDPRIKYLIWNRRICNASAIGSVAAWTWRAYTGSNPHDHHFHLSVKPDKAHYDDRAAWVIAADSNEAVAEPLQDVDAEIQASLSLLDSGAPAEDDPLPRMLEMREALDRLLAIRAQSTPMAEDFTEAPPPSFESLKARYESLFAGARVAAEHRGVVQWHVGMLKRGRGRYEEVQARTGAPWWFVGIVHGLEAGFNFAGHLHNGDPLTARTVQVPSGRPKVWNPPSDWLSSALDAIGIKGYAGQTDWTLARTLWRMERYNGFGYYGKGINSPYLWSFSNQYTKGKYVRDGVYDPNAVSKQCGAAVMLRALVDAGLVPPVPL